MYLSSFKEYFQISKISKKFSEKDWAHKVYEFFTTAEEDEKKKTATSMTKKTLLWLHTHTYSVISLLLILITFTALLYGLTQYLKLCFF